MRILAIETVGFHGSIAALEDDRLLVEHRLDDSRRSAQTLAPGIAELLAGVAWKPRDVQLVAVASGPGSFTGLRVGVTTAKVFAWSVGCAAVGVNTLLAIAAQAPIEVDRVSVALDAQRGEVFAAEFARRPAGTWGGEATTRIVRNEAWLSGLAPGTWVTGPALGLLADRLPGGVRAVDPARWIARAGTVGQLGREMAPGDVASVFDLVPRYFRATAAEEKRAVSDRPRSA